MLKIDPSTLSAKEVYKFFIGSIIPRPIAFVTSKGSGGVINGAPFSFFNIVSSNPPILSVAVQRNGGNEKDTAKNIKEYSEFVIHVCDEDNIAAINETAANLPPDESEIELAGLSVAESSVISVPGIKEAKVRIECKLEGIVEIKDDNGIPTCDLILGRAVCFHIEDQLYENGRIDPKLLKPVSRLAGNDYSKLGEMFTINRPK